MSLVSDFKQFALKGNVIDLAVAVVIGGAFGKIVSAIVADLIMPLVAWPLSFLGTEWRNYSVTPLHLKVGDVLGAVIDFVVVAFVLFVLVIKLMGVLRKRAPTPEPAKTKECPECLESIPQAARRCRACGSVVVAAAALLLVMLAPARATADPPTDPKFEFGKAEKNAKEVEWKVQAKAGLLLTSGNSQTSTVTAGTSLLRKEAGNRFAFDAGLAYARSNVLVASDKNGNGLIDPGELSRQSQVTANNWAIKARYDRFFTEHNSAYVAALSGADQPAGKDFTGGGQVGYSRQLYKDDRFEVVGEIGYDLSYESYITPTDASTTVHSARLFVGGNAKISSLTSAFVQGETLLNLNRETAPNANDPTKTTVDPLDDTRVVAKAGITTTLWKNVSFSFSFTTRYDHNPAPRPAIAGAPMFAPGYLPFADTTDTLTEATLIVNFL
jgi:large conductance mechanosensitive channel